MQAGTKVAYRKSNGRLELGYIKDFNCEKAFARIRTVTGNVVTVKNFFPQTVEILEKYAKENDEYEQH